MNDDRQVDTVDSTKIAEVESQFRAAASQFLDADAIKHTLREVLPATGGALAESAATSMAKYSANMTVILGLFYVRIVVTLTDPVTIDGHTRRWEFRGDSGGLASIGGGVMMGTVFSNTPLKQVFADTRRFQANLAIVESNVFFLDKNSKTLAWFIGGGLATGGGISGGTGDWTPL